MKIAGYAVVMALTFAAGSARAIPTADAPRPAVDAPAVDKEVADLLRVTQKIEAGDLSGARPLLEAVLDSPAFGKLRPADRDQAKGLYDMLLQVTDHPAWVKQVRRQSEAADATDEDWRFRLAAALEAHDKADAMLSVATTARRWPKSLAKIGDEGILWVAFEAQTDQALADPFVDMLDALDSARWTPTSRFHSADVLWFELSRALLERGDTRAARRVASQITEPTIVADMLIDRRYDAITTADPGRYDIGKAAHRRIATLVSDTAAEPASLEGLNTLAESLINANRTREALVILDSALERAARVGPKPAFSDADQLNWTYDLRSRALFLQGRGEDALAALKTGAQMAEHGHVNVEQSLRLADMEVRLGDPDAGLKTAAAVSPFRLGASGRTIRHAVLVESFALLNQPTKLRAQLADVMDHSKDAPSWAIDSQLAAGDMDGAARTIVAMLADPAQRSFALKKIQDYRYSDTAPGYLKQHHAKIVALRERPEVKAAVDAVGRVISIPLIESESQ